MTDFIAPDIPDLIEFDSVMTPERRDFLTKLRTRTEEQISALPRFERAGIDIVQIKVDLRDAIKRIDALLKA